MSSATLNPRLAEWVSYANAIRYQLLEYVEALPSEAFEKRLDEEGWTVAGVLEHLTLIEDSIGRLITRMSKQIRADGHPPESDFSSILNTLDAFCADDNRKKLVAPELYRPAGTITVSEILQKLVDVRSRVLSAVELANDIDLTKASFPHPYFGPLTGYQWLVLIAQHELRHLKQIQEIMNAQPAKTAPATTESR